MIDYWLAFRGALVRLFGEPLVDQGDDYEYLIEAVAPDGATCILAAYNGTIRSHVDDHANKPMLIAAGIALRDLVESTVPADYERTYFNSEYGTTSTYGCRDGLCYSYEARGRYTHVTQVMHEQFQQQSEAEFEQYVSWCEETGSCFHCRGKGIYHQRAGFDDAGQPILVELAEVCPHCSGSGKASQ
ncbi:MAG TPA: hypothetical protein VGD69_15300 [Herpetosiphonaceae bacterium]